MVTKPRGVCRCEAYQECAYWARTKFKCPENGKPHYPTGKRELYLCDNCARIYRLDGWQPMEKKE